MDVIGGMVLAAGLSERMSGSLPKQLLPLGGLTLAAVSVRNAEESVLDKVVVVVGHQADRIRDSVSGGRAEVVGNPDYRLGNMTSFRVGAAALGSCDAYMILLADMPGVDSVMIDEAVAQWQRTRPWAAVSSYSDGRAHPIVLSAGAMAAAVEVEGPKGVWRFLAEASQPVAQIVFDFPMPADINTQEEYDRLLHLHDEAAQDS